MQIQNKHPFDIWQSQKVTDLLVDFFSQNFERAGLKAQEGGSYVLKAWNEKSVKDWEVLRDECNEIINDYKTKLVSVPDETNSLDLIDLVGIETYLDIGANKLATINHYAKRFPNVKKFIGVDVVPKVADFIEPEISEYYQVAEDAESYPIPDQSVDLVNIQFVLHHVESLETIRKILGIVKKVLKPTGRFILFEESFVSNPDFETLAKNDEKLGIKTDIDLTKRFYDLSEDEKFEFIIANDWLININVPHIQWTGQYYTWEKWLEILSEFGFVQEKSYNLGLRVNGKIKQGVHMIGEFRVE